MTCQGNGHPSSVEESSGYPMAGGPPARLATVTLICGCVLERPVPDGDDESDASFYASIWAARDALDRVDRMWNCPLHEGQRIVSATFD